MPRATAHGSASAQIQLTGERRPDFALRIRGEVNDGRAAGIPGDLSPRPSSKGGRQVRTDIFLPAAGNRNGTSLNNAGSNGNYWSSSPNPNNSDNAYNMNFNSGNHDWSNNDRFLGFTVRPVSE